MAVKILNFDPKTFGDNALRELNEIENKTKTASAGRLVNESSNNHLGKFSRPRVSLSVPSLKEETEDVLVAANVVGFHGIMGVNMTSHLLLDELIKDRVQFLSDFDLMVLPGGVKALEKLRQEKGYFFHQGLGSRW